MQKTVKHLLGEKGREVWSVAPGATVLSALEILAEKEVGALPVVEDGTLVGIFSERDYARKVVLHGRSSRDMRVEEIMSRRVLCVGPERTVEECMALMTDKRIRHLPVLEDGELTGIVSIGDVVRAVISEREFMIQLLENYIYGPEPGGATTSIVTG